MFIVKVCPNCHAQIDDNAIFCSNCGTNFSSNQYVAVDPYDHTAEFDATDISENKVFAMLPYLLGTIGIIIALLASNTSQYVRFHVRQAIKFTVCSILAGICAVILCWTFIVPIAYIILAMVFLVLKIICFFQICGGKAKEPAIIRDLGFLK